MRSRTTNLPRSGSVCRILSAFDLTSSIIEKGCYLFPGGMVWLVVSSDIKDNLELLELLEQEIGERQALGFQLIIINDTNVAEQGEIRGFGCDGELGVAASHLQVQV